MIVPTTKLRLAFPFALLMAMSCPPTVQGEDWPQILGPNRNGVTSETIPSWSPDGLKEVWSTEAGSGFSGVAVASNVAVVFSRKENSELLTAFHADTGRQIWRAAFPASYQGGINPDAGPRCVPVIHKDLVIAFGAGGDLYCLRLLDGKKQWSRSLSRDYRALDGYFGAGSTPLVMGELVLVNVGGRDNAGIVAVRLSDGETAWKGGDDNASYSSPTTMMYGNKPHAVFVTRLHCVGLEPVSGKEVFRFRFGKTGPTVNAATPLVFEKNYLFLSASYRIGAELHRLSDGELEKVWANDESMSSQYTTCVYRQGLLYGIHGREDAGAGALRCIEAKSGKVRWTHTSNVGHVLLAKDRLLVQEVTGRLTLVKAEGTKYEKLAEHQLQPEGDWRAIPAISNGRLYVRNSTTATVHCLELKSR